MPGCSGPSSSMTGPRDLGPVQPHSESTPSPDLGEGIQLQFRSSGRQDHQRQIKRKMAPVSGCGSPMQLTPIWEYVVRTGRFPPNVEVSAIFHEIWQRLRDPEWEVRQHALRVLIDVLPTLDPDILDDIGGPVVTELVNNLGNYAPAVRKGSLDALRVYLLHCHNRDEMTKEILKDGLNRPDAFDNHHSNVIAGMVLSTPLLLFPSRDSPHPSKDVIYDAVQALFIQLMQMNFQEVSIRSLAKIRDTVGDDEFEFHICDIDDKTRRNFEVLCDVYGIKRTRPKRKATPIVPRKVDTNTLSEPISNPLESDTDVSGIVERDDSEVESAIPPARVVLETEIKFDEETAITMTILEEKDFSDDSDLDSDADDDDLQIARQHMQSTPRKLPRRVHFGGEVVKLRTPDSEDSVSIEAPPTRIPLPVSPATKMPPHRRGRSASHPCAPNIAEYNQMRISRSASSSPKRGIYTHDATLSPKKSILLRTSSPSIRSRRNSLTSADRPFSADVLYRENSFRKDRSKSFKIFDDTLDNSAKEILPESGSKTSPKNQSPVHKLENHDTLRTELSSKNDTSLVIIEIDDSQEKRMKDLENLRKAKIRSKSAVDTVTRTGDEVQLKESLEMKEARRRHSAKIPGFEAFPRQERNYILMELASPTKQDKNRLDDKTSNEHTNISISYAEDPIADNKNESQDIKADEGRVISTIDNAKDIHETTKECLHQEDSKSSENLNEDEVDECNVECELEKKNDLKDRSSESSSDNEGRNHEPSWEDLGLVDDEVLHDFHNKEDWRARVRGLERIASALRMSSALVTIEPRVGSLLQAVLGGERSCRVSAAGFSVAKVVLTGVSEDSLKRSLTLITWGLARQGGPNAAHLARITMQRVKPSLFLDRLLQHQCIGARNAKTRENALQLLIFSLVTFPSTEFQAKTVASKVVTMVGDSRKRVRQAALDTLAVLAQIYESEEILKAAKQVTRNRADGTAMYAAIRARLARKALPMVSSDGLVVYGLQISPISQSITGADVDWIIAGSGSVSPGTGRTRGQIIAMSTPDPEMKPNELSKKELGRKGKAGIPHAEKGSENNERSSSWKLLGQSGEDANQNKERRWSVKDSNPKPPPENRVKRSKTEIYIRRPKAADESHRQPFSTVKINRYVENQNLNSRRVNDEDYARKSRSRPYDEVELKRPRTISAPPQGRTVIKSESRIPVLNTRDRIVEHQSYTKASAHREMDAHSTQERRERRLSTPECLENATSCHENGGPSTQQRKRHLAKNTSDRMSPKGKSSPVCHSTKVEYRTGHGDRLPHNAELISRNSRENAKSAPHYNYSAQIQDRYDSVHRRKRSHTESSPRLAKPATRNHSRTRPHHTVHSNIGDRHPDYRDKHITEEDQFNARNIQDYSRQDVYQIPTITDNVLAYDELDHVRSNSESSVSSNRSSRGRRSTSKQSMHEHVENDNHSDEKSSTSSLYNPAEDKAFDVITTQSIPGRPNSTDSDIMSSNANSDPNEVYEDAERMSNSDDHDIPAVSHSVMAFGEQIRPPGVDETSDDEYANENYRRPKSVATIVSTGTIISANRVRKQSIESLPSCTSERELYDIPPKSSISPKKSPSIHSYRPATNQSINARSSRSTPERAISVHNSPSKTMVVDGDAGDDIDGEMEIASVYPEEAASFTALEYVVGEVNTTESTYPMSIPQSRAASEYEMCVGSDPNLRPSSADNIPLSPKISSPERFISEVSIPLDDRFDTSSPVRIGFDDDGRIESTGSEESKEHQQTPRRLPGTLPKTKRRPIKTEIKSRFGANRATSVPATRKLEKQSEKTKMVQQCFSQLEHKDWEVVMKGLKTLSEIARDYPEQLDKCSPGIVSRVLGKHVRNLRSQVARAACLASGDVFNSHIRGIDHDLDEVAGPLLNRTADTNRFLRADSNAALDSMVQNLSPQRTIGIIANRGATHQNAIVRAETARLLAAILNRIGPDHVMTLSRDARDKLLCAGAKLLIDGNLDARKHAKGMFRKLVRCDGFRKALTDAVPDSTLRNIEKTLKSL